MFSNKKNYHSAAELCRRSDALEKNVESVNLSTAQIFDFGLNGDMSLGCLTAAQVGKNVPFEIKRVYWTYFTKNDVIRGNHAHRKLKQIIFAVSGEIEIEIETPKRKKTIYKLSEPCFGLYVPEMHWRTLKFSQGAVLLSLASLEYDEEEYIRDYTEFDEICSS